ncbi:retinol dehydrogenase 14 [Dendryphion nanum]|uniref:Retinol dehydrogenase 14 n=1 Tax=Dendryphion nanum TaxID=256645 RepID=A0A9P9DUF0_9PLEO|nr:retinol dehydrogenase 14 [Dendryphion nanum]
MNLCKSSVPFKAERDIPSLEGKVILVTGGNIGLGKQTIIEYARHNPAQIWLAARNLEKAKIAVEEIKQQLPSVASPNIKLLKLDLSSMDSVKTAANTFLKEADRLDILVLNAGIMATAPDRTQDGYELQFGTNYIGHALLAKLLIPALNKAASLPGSDVRVVMVSTYGHSLAPKEGIRYTTLREDGTELGPYGCYGQSKLAMILWVRKFAALYPQFTTAAVHPGLVRTNLMTGATGQSFLLKMVGYVAEKVGTSVEQGVKNQLWASVAQDVKSGEYYEPVGIGGTATALGKDDTLAEKLWQWTETDLAAWVS